MKNRRSAQLTAPGPKIAKLFRLRKPSADQIELASAASGVEQQQIVEDALALYFNPADPAAAAQRQAILARLAANGLTLPGPADLTRLQKELRPGRRGTKPAR